MMEMLKAVSLVFVLVELCFGAFAQTQTGVVTQTTTGIQPLQAYDGARENINLGNGSLHVEIPLISLPQRGGHNLDFGIEYDSEIFNLVIDSVPPNGSVTFWSSTARPNHFDPSQLGWRLMVPYLSSSMVVGGPGGSQNWSYQTNYSLTLSDGSTHMFSNIGGCVNNPPACTGSGLMTSYSSDNQFIHLDTTSSTTAVATTEDGTRYYFSIYGGLPNSIEDTNGNIITFSCNGGTCEGIPLPTSITDTLGRAITFTYSTVNNVSSLTSVTYKNSDGQTSTFKFNYDSITLDPTFVDPTSNCCVYAGNLELHGDSTEMLQSVTLPTSESYSFQYDAFGELTNISYPTGGYTAYQWARFESTVPTYGQVDARELVEKEVCRGASGTCSTLDTTTYSPTLMSGTVQPYSYTNSEMVAVDPMGNQTITHFTTTGYNIVQPSSVASYTGTSTPVKTVNYSYTPFPNSCPSDDEWGQVGSGLPTQITTTLNDTNQVSKVTLTYDTFSYVYPGGSCTVYIPNETSKSEYEYGNGSAGSVVRTTATTWLKGSSYTSSNILNRELSMAVANSAGTTMAQTQYVYDTYTGGISASGAVNHDSSRGTSYTIRGNVTAIEKWRNTDGAWLTTQNTYDDAGNILSKTAPSNSPYDSYTRKTTYSFADSWGNSTCAPTGGNAAAFPTTVTDAAGLVTNYTYNSCTGTVASAKDPNSQVTSYSYDLINRVSETTFPDTSTQTKVYSDDSDAAPPFTVQTTAQLTASLNEVSTVVLDGLGRNSESQLNSDPDCTSSTGVKVDTGYDGDERVSTVSNAYCTTSDATYGLTTTDYDGLSRATLSIPPDGTGTSDHVATAYTGNCATITDEAGHSRKTCTDAEGRLSQVFEDPNGLDYETDYTYDALDDLQQVTQKGNAPSTQWRTRTFTYNSLGDLLCSANPEIGTGTCPAVDSGSYIAGTIRYAYDNIGNLISKSSPLPNQSSNSTTVTANYTYDADNRATKKSYSDGVTPLAMVAYDGNTLSGCVTTPPSLTDPYPKGHETSMCDGSGAVSWSYDQRGRISGESRTIVGSTSLTKTTTYTHNYDGSLNTVTYPLTGTTMRYTINGAGRATAVSDTTHSYNFALNGHYAPIGTLSSLQMGVAPITIADTYNNRLQPNLISASTSAATVMSLNYNYNLGTSDNGNVAQIVNNRNNNRTQEFQYDTLNRISEAYSSGSIWGETYSIDAWGDLYGRNQVSGKSTYEPLSVVPTTQNQLTGFTYDAPGNMFQTSGTVYDAENRVIVAEGYAYFYDGTGERVKKCASTQAYTCTSGGGGTLYWPGGDSALVESDQNGNSQEEYVFFGSDRIARRDVNGEAVHFYFTDHLGTTDLVSDANGDMPPEEEEDFYPFGAEMVITSGDPNHYKFTGKERDTETGNDYFGARYYANGLGRYLTTDWAAKAEPVPYAKLTSPQTLNLYAYVSNNPSNITDLDGHAYMAGEMLPPGLDFDFIEYIEGRGNGIDPMVHENQAMQLAQQLAAMANSDYLDSVARDQANSQPAQQNGSSSVDDKRNAIGNTAASLKGSTKWSYDAAPCGWKCNVFVHDVLRLVGIGGNGEPNAGQLADPNHHMTGWTDAANGDFAQLHVGDIVAYAYAPGTHSVASGDSGIISAINGDSVRVTAAGQRSVYTESLSEWRAGSNSPGRPFMVRTYVGP